VTLLGLHGAGTMAPSNSGFKGTLGSPHIDFNKVSNNYYKSLLGINSPQTLYSQVIH